MHCYNDYFAATFNFKTGTGPDTTSLGKYFNTYFPYMNMN